MQNGQKYMGGRWLATNWTIENIPSNIRSSGSQPQSNTPHVIVLLSSRAPEKKTHEKRQQKKMHMKTITDALRFGRLCLPFQHGDDEVPVVCFWGWFGWWNNICIFQEQTSSSSSSLRVTISVNDWKGQCYWPFSPLNDNLRSFFGGKSIMCFEIIHETFKQMQEMPGHSVWARHDNSQIWIKLNKSCCGIHEVEWAT